MSLAHLGALSSEASPMSDTPSTIATKAAQFDTCPNMEQIDEMLAILSDMKRNQFVIETENDLLELRSSVKAAKG